MMQLEIKPMTSHSQGEHYNTETLLPAVNTEWVVIEIFIAIYK